MAQSVHILQLIFSAEKLGESSVKQAPSLESIERAEKERERAENKREMKDNEDSETDVLNESFRGEREWCRDIRF
jgi:hypothetical protein